MQLYRLVVLEFTPDKRCHNVPSCGSHKMHIFVATGGLFQQDNLY